MPWRTHSKASWADVRTPKPFGPAGPNPSAGRRQSSRLRSFAEKPGANCGRINGYPKGSPAAEFLLEEPLVVDSERMPGLEPGTVHSAKNNTQAFVKGGSSGPLHANGSKFAKGKNQIIESPTEQNDLGGILGGHGGHNGYPHGKGMNGTAVSGEGFMNTDLSLLSLHEIERPLHEDYWIPQVRDREPGSGAVFAVEMNVRDYELDQYGVVNHSVFINYLDHARHEFLAHIGLDPDSVAKSGNAMAIVRQELKYCGPLRSRDKFRSTVFVTKVTKARCIWTEEIWKIGEQDELVASAETEGLCLDKDYRPIRVPAFAVENLKNFSRGSDVCVHK